MWCGSVDDLLPYHTLAPIAQPQATSVLASLAECLSVLGLVGDCVMQVWVELWDGGGSSVSLTYACLLIFFWL